MKTLNKADILSVLDTLDKYLLIICDNEPFDSIHMFESMQNELIATTLSIDYRFKSYVVAWLEKIYKYKRIGNNEVVAPFAHTDGSSEKEDNTDTNYFDYENIVMNAFKQNFKYAWTPCSEELTKDVTGDVIVKEESNDDIASSSIDVRKLELIESQFENITKQGVDSTENLDGNRMNIVEVDVALSGFPSSTRERPTKAIYRINTSIEVGDCIEICTRNEIEDIVKNRVRSVNSLKQNNELGEDPDADCMQSGPTQWYVVNNIECNKQERGTCAFNVQLTLVMDTMASAEHPLELTVPCDELCGKMVQRRMILTDNKKDANDIGFPITTAGYFRIPSPDVAHALLLFDHYFKQFQYSFIVARQQRWLSKYPKSMHKQLLAVQRLNYNVELLYGNTKASNDSNHVGLTHPYLPPPSSIISVSMLTYNCQKWLQHKAYINAVKQLLMHNYEYTSKNKNYQLYYTHECWYNVGYCMKILDSYFSDDVTPTAPSSSSQDLKNKCSRRKTKNKNTSIHAKQNDEKQQATTNSNCIPSCNILFKEWVRWSKYYDKLVCQFYAQDCESTWLHSFRIVTNADDPEIARARIFIQQHKNMMTSEKQRARETKAEHQKYNPNQHVTVPLISRLVKDVTNIALKSNNCRRKCVLFRDVDVLNGSWRNPYSRSNGVSGVTEQTSLSSITVLANLHEYIHYGKAQVDTNRLSASTVALPYYKNETLRMNVQIPAILKVGDIIGLQYNIGYLLKYFKCDPEHTETPVANELCNEPYSLSNDFLLFYYEITNIDVLLNSFKLKPYMYMNENNHGIDSISHANNEHRYVTLYDVLAYHVNYFDSIPCDASYWISMNCLWKVLVIRFDHTELLLNNCQSNEKEINVNANSNCIKYWMFQTPTPSKEVAFNILAKHLNPAI